MKYTGRSKKDLYKNGRLGLKQMELKEYQVIKNVEKLTYSQDWTNYNKARTSQRTIAQILLIELIKLLEDLKQPSTNVGRPSTNIREKLLSMFTYTYYQLDSRRCIPEIEQLHRLKLISKVPHFNTILNFFRESKMTSLLLDLIEITSLPMKPYEEHFSPDASGFSCYTFKKWLDIRTQKESKKKEWLKIHVISGAKTNIITSVAITEGKCNDGPQFIPLLEKTAKNFEIKELSADKAYLSRKNLQAIAKIGVIPYIPFKSNSTAKSKRYPIWNTMFHFFHSNQKAFYQRYHLRSNIEATFSMLKRNFGHKLRTKNFTSQLNEILMKCLCHNLCILVKESFELGLDINLNKCAENYFAQK